MKNRTGLGVVITTWMNTDTQVDYLKRVLAGLMVRLNHVHGDCICIVDECSPKRDELAHLIHGMQTDIPIQGDTIPIDGYIDDTQHTRPWQLARSRNLGAAHCFAMNPALAGIVFLDADCVPIQDWDVAYRIWMATHQGMGFGCTYHQPRPYDGVIRDGEEAIQAWQWNEGGPGRGAIDTLLVGQSIDPRLTASGISTGYTADHPWFPLASLFERGGGGNCIVTAGMLQSMGGFDEEYAGGFGYEETDLAVRVYQAGGSVHYITGAKVVHQWHPRSGDHFEGLTRNARRFRERTGMFTGQRPKADTGIQVHISPESMGPVNVDEAFQRGFAAGLAQVRSEGKGS